MSLEACSCKTFFWASCIGFCELWLKRGGMGGGGVNQSVCICMKGIEGRREESVGETNWGIFFFFSYSLLTNHPVSNSLLLSELQ